MILYVSLYLILSIAMNTMTVGYQNYNKDKQEMVLLVLTYLHNLEELKQCLAHDEVHPMNTQNPDCLQAVVYQKLQRLKKLH